MIRLTIQKIKTVPCLIHFLQLLYDLLSSLLIERLGNLKLDNKFFNSNPKKWNNDTIHANQILENVYL